MKFRKIVSTTLFFLFLVGCSASESVTEDSVSYSVNEETSTVDMNPVTSTTTIMETTFTTESSEFTETTEHNPIFYMRCIEADGALPDGEYIIRISDFDDDYYGATCSIDGYYYFTYDELMTLEEGDTVFVGDTGYTVNSINPKGEYSVAGLVSNIDEYEHIVVTRLNDDFFYLRNGEDESIYSYNIYSEYHLCFSDDLVAWDLYSPLEDIPYGVAGHKFKDVQEFEQLIEEVKEWHLEDQKQYPGYYDFTNWCIDIHATIEEGKVIYMLAHPNGHQDWVPYDVRMRYEESS